MDGLPDEAICQILSFLPTKLSVQTSVLSKRWKFLWAHVPLLEFQADTTLNSNIITKILLQHNHDIHTFRLYISQLDGIEEEFQSWIANITARNIRNLVIRVETRCLYELPQCLFTCKTLVDLLLSRCGDIPKNCMYLPALKKLNLECVGYKSQESLSRLISGCPMLEELNVYRGFLNECFVLSPTLTRLDLQIFGDCKVKLDTPALRYLSLECFMPDEISVGALDSLIEADISLYWDKEDQDNLVYLRNVLAFVGKLRSVKLLTLATDPVVMIHDLSFSTLAIKFHNLTKLYLHSDWGFITSFLENADNLQDLILHMLNLVDIENQNHWMETIQVPACLISHLRTVKVYHFGCSKQDFDMVRYILMNANVLEMMEIQAVLGKRDWENKFEALKMLSLFRRGSKKCQLTFD